MRYPLKVGEQQQRALLLLGTEHSILQRMALAICGKVGPPPLAPLYYLSGRRNRSRATKNTAYF